MTMENGYPAEADIDAYLTARGFEIITENNTNFYLEYKQQVWRMLNDTDWAAALAVYADSATTIKVRGGKYLWKDTVKTYSTGSAINPTDNDTTYAWMKSNNTVDSAIDGTGWPTTEHIKLAEIDVDSDGDITAIRDMRGNGLMAALGNYLIEAGASVEALAVHWDSPSPADDDELRIPLYAENDAGEKIEYARIVMKLTDVSDGSEDADVSFMKMIAGVLTTMGDIVGTSATQTLTNKTFGDVTKKIQLPIAVGGGTADISTITGAPSINLDADGETFYASFQMPHDWKGGGDLTLKAKVQNEIAEDDGDDVSITCTVHGIADGETGADAGQSVAMTLNLTGGDEAINKVNQVSGVIDYDHGTYPIVAGDTVVIKSVVNLAGGGECTGPLHIVDRWVEFTSNTI